MNLIPLDQSWALEWGWAGAALGGAPESGDLHVVEPRSHGALLAVIDGLGHGYQAATAARQAASIVRSHATASVRELLERCHEGLHGTRGVVMSVVALDAPSSSIEWSGVGNVECVLFRSHVAKDRANEAVSARGGVLGFRLPPLKVNTARVFAGDLLILASDGIRSDFTASVPLDWPTQAIADWLLQSYARKSDDALALVARYVEVVT